MISNLFLYIICLSSSLLTQLETLVHAQFAKHEPAEWIGAYEGTLEGSFPLVMVIGRRGSEVKGIYQYKDFDHKFVVEGEWTENEIQLVEWDENEMLSGYLVLEYSERKLNGKWYNVSRELQMELVLESIDNSQNWNWPVKEDWIKKYTGRFSNGRVDLLLQKDRSLYSGVLKMNSTKKEYFLTGQCDNSDCDKVLLHLTNETGDVVGNMETQFVQNRIANVSFDMINLPTEYFTFVQNEKLDLEIHETINYCSLIDQVLPGPSELHEAITTFYDSLYQKEAKLDPIPANRFQTRQYGWQEIYHISDRLYSASLFNQDQDMHSAQTKIINFDRKKNEIIPIESLFKRRVDHSELFSKKIESKLNESKILDWITEDFQQIGLTERGFIVTTGFDVIRGQHKLILPYKLFREYLAKGTIIESFNN